MRIFFLLFFLVRTKTKVNTHNYTKPVRYESLKENSKQSKRSKWTSEKMRAKEMLSFSLQQTRGRPSEQGLKAAFIVVMRSIISRWQSAFWWWALLLPCRAVRLANKFTGKKSFDNKAKSSGWSLGAWSLLWNRIRFFSRDQINNKKTSSSLTDQNKVPTAVVMKYVYWKLCGKPECSMIHKYKCWFAIFLLTLLSLNNLN